MKIISTGATLTANQAGGTYQWLDCDNSNAPIAGATGQSFTAINTGNYAVQVTANGCTEVSACSFVSTIGINEEYTVDFKLYPNPTENQFVIDFGSEVERYTINLYSIDGRLIQQHTSMTGKTFHLSLEQHPAATYLLQVVTPNGVSSMIRISKI